jgi:hypothetical protein
MEIPEANQAFPVQPEDALDNLIEKIQNFSISDSTRIHSNKFESYLDSALATLL